MFVEIDRGTGKVASRTYRSFVGQAVKYHACLRAEGYSRFKEIFDFPFRGFQVLYVTTSERRITNFQKALGDVARFERTFLFTRFMDLNPESVFKKIWRPSRIEDQNLYSIIG